ncbi:MAG: hypothetical protein ACYS83_05820 [Planctomycetota bacterium]|jgi:hypothetical protein
MKIKLIKHVVTVEVRLGRKTAAAVLTMPKRLDEQLVENFVAKYTEANDNR